ncbi:MAG: YgaP family membrane protein [Patescibacteria group bacterium]
MFRTNEGPLDRLLRATFGAILLLAGIFYLAGVWQWVVIILAFIFFATAILGFCGAYTLLKFDTLKCGKNWPSWVAWLWIVLLVICAALFYISQQL